jgi:hypothetical protein
MKTENHRRYVIFNGEEMEKIFNGQKTAKLGTEKNPAVVRVQTQKRLKEVASILEKNGWKYTIGLEPDKPEDIADLEIRNIIESTQNYYGRKESWPQ